MQEVTKELQPRWNAVIIDVLSVFIRICEAQGLRYFCAGGTAIGAVNVIRVSQKGNQTIRE